MNTSTNVTSLAARIEHLERAVKRSQITSIALFIAFATQTMNHLRIVDANGVDRVDIDQDGIGIAGPSGGYRQVLGIDSKTGDGFYEMRSSNKSLIIDINGNSTAPFMRMRDASGTERVYLGVTTGGASSLLQFNNAAGQKQVFLEGLGRALS